MVSLADVGVLTGLPRYFDAAAAHVDRRRRRARCTSPAASGRPATKASASRTSLPNISAYSETCAVLMFMTLNHRLFLATGDASTSTCSSAGCTTTRSSGVSAIGNHFFYVNRLASAGDGRDTRWERASLECCPPNLVRFLASMPGYIYAQDKRDAVYVNLYVSSDASFTVGGKTLALAVDSEMPWGGRSTITVSTSAAAVRATIKLRIPGWARNHPVPGASTRTSTALGEPTTLPVNGKRGRAVPTVGLRHARPRLDERRLDRDRISVGRAPRRRR